MGRQARYHAASVLEFLKHAPKVAGVVFIAYLVFDYNLKCSKQGINPVCPWVFTLSMAALIIVAVAAMTMQLLWSGRHRR